MQIVIDIPSEIKAVIDKNGTNEVVTETLWKAVKNGVQLPKGHGELIDRNDLKYEKYNSYAYAIANAPTIIESDKAESEEV